MFLQDMVKKGPKLYYAKTMMNKKIDCVTVGDIRTNCWLYATEDPPNRSGQQPCVIIDPGDEADLIISRLRELNWIPLYIFLTHGHLDHLAALPDLLSVFGKSSSNPGWVPKIYIHRLDVDYLGKNALSVHRRCFSAGGGDTAFVDALWKPLPEADSFFEEKDTAGPFTVLHLPGHSPGSVGLYDEKAGVLFSGDTLFRGNYGRTDLPGGDWNQLAQSLKRLLSMEEDTVVCPGHGEPTTIKEEIQVKNNGLFCR